MWIGFSRISLECCFIHTLYNAANVGASNTWKRSTCATSSSSVETCFFSFLTRYLKHWHTLALTHLRTWWRTLVYWYEFCVMPYNPQFPTAVCLMTRTVTKRMHLQNKKCKPIPIWLCGLLCYVSYCHFFHNYHRQELWWTLTSMDNDSLD